MLKRSRSSGHDGLVSHIQRTPGYRLVILPCLLESVFSTSSVNVHSQISFLSSLTLALFLWASLALGRDSSYTSLPKCNPLNLSSPSWCFWTHLVFIPLLSPQYSFKVFSLFFYINNRKHVHRHVRWRYVRIFLANRSNTLCQMSKNQCQWMRGLLHLFTLSK